MATARIQISRRTPLTRFLDDRTMPRLFVPTNYVTDASVSVPPAVSGGTSTVDESTIGTHLGTVPNTAGLGGLSPSEGDSVYQSNIDLQKVYQGGVWVPNGRTRSSHTSAEIDTIIATGEFPDNTKVLCNEDNTLYVYKDALGDVIPVQGGGDGFTDPTVTNTFATQEHDWIDMATEATLDLGASSPAQKTTLTAARTLAFTGAVPADKHRTYYAEVAPGAFALSLATANDPEGGYAASAATVLANPHIIAFKTSSTGTPIFVGAVRVG